MPRSSRNPGVGSKKGQSSGTPAERALALMIDALDILDRSGGPGVAGAHLDLAIHRLRESIDRAKDEESFSSG